MKLTEQKLRQVIREVIQTEDFGQSVDPTHIGKNYDSNKKSNPNALKMFGPGYSSKEAHSLVSRNVKANSKILKQVKYKLIKGWMDLAKSGHVDFFDIMRGTTTGDIRRASGNEIEFMKSMLSQDNIQDGFRKYFKGRKSMPTRKWK